MPMMISDDAQEAQPPSAVALRVVHVEATNDPCFTLFIILSVSPPAAKGARAASGLFPPKKADLVKSQSPSMVS